MIRHCILLSLVIAALTEIVVFQGNKQSDFLSFDTNNELDVTVTLDTKFDDKLDMYVMYKNQIRQSYLNQSSFVIQEKVETGWKFVVNNTNPYNVTAIYTLEFEEEEYEPSVFPPWLVITIIVVVVVVIIGICCCVLNWADKPLL